MGLRQRPSGGPLRRGSWQGREAQAESVVFTKDRVMPFIFTAKGIEGRSKLTLSPAVLSPHLSHLKERGAGGWDAGVRARVREDAWFSFALVLPALESREPSGTPSSSPRTGLRRGGSGPWHQPPPSTAPRQLEALRGIPRSCLFFLSLWKLKGRDRPPSGVRGSLDGSCTSSGSLLPTASGVGRRARPFQRAHQTLPPSSTRVGKLAARGPHLPSQGSALSLKRAGGQDGERWD